MKRVSNSDKKKDQNELKFKENIKTDISGENTEHKTGARGEEEKPAKTARCQRYKTDSSSLTLRQNKLECMSGETC
jgi:hypothetical protein